MKNQRVGLVALVFGFCACSGAASSGSGEHGHGPWHLTLEPSTALESAAAVVALHVSGQKEDSIPTDAILVEGEPTATAIQRYRGGETTDGLAERIVPTLSVRGASGLVIRPHNVLAVGQRYTLLAREGVVGSVLVGDEPRRPYLARAWPPVESALPTSQLIYCGPTAPFESVTLELFPLNQTARLEPGINDHGLGRGACVRLVVTNASDDLLQPPVQLAGYSFQPSPFRARPDTPTELPVAACDNSEIRFATGCLRVAKGRGIVRTPANQSLWAVSGSLGWHVEAIDAGAEFAIPLQQEANEFRLEATVVDLLGRSCSTSTWLKPDPPSARLVINEIMANPLGPEPEEEWVELFNDGAIAADVIGWKLRDESAEIEIPALSIAPSAFVLLVRNDYAGGLSGDLVPPANASLVRMPQLGKAGLLNSGEVLALVDGSGQVVSRFPARPSPRQGVSIARREAMTLDDDPDGFVAHAYPGASPGRANSVE